MGLLICGSALVKVDGESKEPFYVSRVQIYPQPDVVIRARAETGEGPVIDRRTGRLCWVDIPRGMLVENDLDTGDQTVTPLGTMLGAAAPRAVHAGFAVAVAEGFGLLVDGELTMVDPVLPEADRRMNDAKCDSSGRLWAGSTRLDFAPGGGALHCWSGDRPSRVVASGLTLPNGLGWDVEDTVMYLIDSKSHRLMSAQYDRDDGEVGVFSTLCEIAPGLPDGLAVDAEGCIWVAVWGGGEVRRYRPGGELIARVPLPVDQPSSCAFGDDGTLYITTATSDMSETKLAQQPLAGSVFALSTHARGVPVQPFGA